MTTPSLSVVPATAAMSILGCSRRKDQQINTILSQKEGVSLFDSCSLCVPLETLRSPGVAVENCMKSSVLCKVRDVSACLLCVFMFPS